MASSNVTGEYSIFSKKNFSEFQIFQNNVENTIKAWLFHLFLQVLRLFCREFVMQSLGSGYQKRPAPHILIGNRITKVQ